MLPSVNDEVLLRPSEAKDTLHKLTTYLAKNHRRMLSDTFLVEKRCRKHPEIVVEDLKVSGMLASHKLAKAISDMGFYELKRQLSYKGELYGCLLTQAERRFPSSKTCSNCGHKKETLSLSERVFNCPDCRFSLDRDLNAAINLKNQGGEFHRGAPVDWRTPTLLK